jgi:tetraacyldisaccharide 4'-kinase
MALLPAAALFYLVAAVRRWAYRLGVLHATNVGVPLVVVGNITAGGTGKTPLVIWLCALLQKHGYRPGIVSRGYGGKGRTRAARPDDDPVDVGDEPVLLANRTACPVWVGPDRVAAARALLAAHPECNVIVSDDGLQHYPMQRDVEIAVVDAAVGLGNGLPIPAGPLREPASRLERVDAVVVNGSAGTPSGDRFGMSLEGAVFANLVDPELKRDAAAFRGQQLHAIAAIGNPGRFFDHLRALGLDFSSHAFPDHHAFVRGDIDFADGLAVVMTEKDAIKCRRFGCPNHWALPVEARIAPGLGERILEKLRKRHGSQAA